MIRLCRRVFKHAPVGPLVLRQSLGGEGGAGAAAGGEGTSSYKTQPQPLIDCQAGEQHVSCPTALFESLQ